MNLLENRVLNSINYKEMYYFIDELISTPSYSGKESRAQDLIADELTELGLNVDKWEIDFDELCRHPDFSMIYERNEGLGVVGTIGIGGKKSLILCGHVDTVASGEIKNWKPPPFKATIKRADTFVGRDKFPLREANLKCNTGDIECDLHLATYLRENWIDAYFFNIRIPFWPPSGIAGDGINLIGCGIDKNIAFNNRHLSLHQYCMGISILRSP